MQPAPDPSAAAAASPAAGGRAARRRGTGPAAADGAAAVVDGRTWQAKLLHAANRLYARGFHHLDVQSRPTLPPTGPAVLVSNHISGLDPLLIQGVLNRVVVWMMAREYYELPVLGWVFRSIEAIPVDRSGRDTAATRAALRALADGRVLGIFPEGKIETTRSLLPFQTGVAMMAARAEVPVYPVYLDGSNRGVEMVPALLAPQEARVRFGLPIAPPTRKGPKPDLDIFTEQIQNAVAKLQHDMT